MPDRTAVAVSHRSLADRARAIVDREQASYIERTRASQRANERARRVMPRGVPSSFQAYEPHPIVIGSATGSSMTDVDGNVYVDLTAGFGVMAVGHRHPAVVAAVQAQAGRLLHAMGDAFPEPIERSLNAVKGAVKDDKKFNVTSERKFVGVDAYEKVIKSGVDLVILTSPPGFRMTTAASCSLMLPCLCMCCRARPPSLASFSVSKPT